MNKWKVTLIVTDNTEQILGRSLIPFSGLEIKKIIQKAVKDLPLGVTVEVVEVKEVKR